MRKIVVCEDGEREAEKIQKILQDDQGIFEEEVNYKGTYDKFCTNYIPDVEPKVLYENR